MQKDRLSMFLEVSFKYPGDDKEYDYDVYMPFPIFIEAFRKLAEGYNMVTVDGTDNAIWNFLVDLDCIDTLEDSEDFLEICRELYKGSSFEEEDYEDFVDDYKMDHNIED